MCNSRVNIIQSRTRVLGKQCLGHRSSEVYALADNRVQSFICLVFLGFCLQTHVVLSSAECGHKLSVSIFAQAYATDHAFPAF